MNGKQKCDYLKRIRVKIAEKNNIEYHIEDCNFHGECLGTCPKCEKELKYLNGKIEEKRSKGETIKLDEFELINLTSTEYEEIQNANNQRVKEMYQNLELNRHNTMGDMYNLLNDEDLMGIFKILDNKKE